MFFHMKLEKNIFMEPKDFGPNLNSKIITKLMKQVEGTCNGKYGFIIAVTKALDVSMGQLIEKAGTSRFTVKYSAIVLRPFPNEVVDTVVTQVTKMGFFCNVGPLMIFVSNHSLPSEFRFDGNTTQLSYVSEEDGETTRIVEGTDVRIRIAGLRLEASNIFGIGTMKGDYLGVLGE